MQHKGWGSTGAGIGNQEEAGAECRVNTSSISSACVCHLVLLNPYSREPGACFAEVFTITSEFLGRCASGKEELSLPNHIEKPGASYLVYKMGIRISPYRKEVKMHLLLFVKHSVLMNTPDQPSWQHMFSGLENNSLQKGRRGAALIFQASEKLGRKLRNPVIAIHVIKCLCPRNLK